MTINNTYIKYTGMFLLMFLLLMLVYNYVFVNLKLIKRYKYISSSIIKQANTHLNTIDYNKIEIKHNTVQVISSSSAVKFNIYPDSKINISKKGSSIDFSISRFGLSNKLSIDISSRVSFPFGETRVVPGVGYYFFFYHSINLGVGVTYDSVYLKLRKQVFPALFRDTGIFFGYHFQYIPSSLIPVSFGVDVGL